MSPCNVLGELLCIWKESLEACYWDAPVESCEGPTSPDWDMTTRCSHGDCGYENKNAPEGLKVVVNVLFFLAPTS